MNKLKSILLKRQHLSAWFILAVGMMAILGWEARDVGLTGSQWFWLMVCTTLVAGLCIWIISWGDDQEDPPPGTQAQPHE